MSLHSATCTVVIDGRPKKGYWTNGDPVTGYVEIDVHRDITVASIEAQLRCEDRGRAYAQDHIDVVDLSVAHKDATEILWESKLISFEFPSDQLVKGKHKFPFEFRLPMEASHLPSSYSIEGHHEFSGTFWGVWAGIDRDQRSRVNYRGFGEIIMYPQRHRSFTGNDDSFASATKVIHMRLHRRPSFMLQEGDLAVVGVEGRVCIPKGGLVQSRKQSKDASSDIRVAVRSLSETENVLVKEIVVFVDTEITTTVQNFMTQTTAVAIASSTKCHELIEPGHGWKDLSQYVAPTRIYGLVETFTTNLHKYSHSLRVQFIVAPEHRPHRTAILEVTIPMILHSEVTITDDVDVQPPPPY